MALEFHLQEVQLANHKSAAKRARQSVKRNVVNTGRRNRVRTVEKSLTKAIVGKQGEEAKTLLQSYMSEVMRAAKSGVVKMETASRKIGRLSARVQAVLTGK